jgi:flagellar biosynthesis protein FliP
MIKASLLQQKTPNEQLSSFLHCHLQSQFLRHKTQKTKNVSFAFRIHKIKEAMQTEILCSANFQIIRMIHREGQTNQPPKSLKPVLSSSGDSDTIA